jgi:hypothetical protein
MWANGGSKEIDVIKKIILAECFAETALKHPDMPKTIDELEKNEALGKKITEGVKGNIDYPNAPLKLFPG